MNLVENPGYQKLKLLHALFLLFFFVFALSFYLTDPQFTNFNIIALFVAALVVALVFTIPTFIIGWIICKILYRGNNRQPISNPGQFDYNPGQYDYHPKEPINDNNQSSNQISSGKPCPHDYASRFKRAVEANDSELAGELLQGWDNNDANYRYASIIYEGMPPTKLSREELYRLLNEADHMIACDESLKQWYRSTAIQVITLNN